MNSNSDLYRLIADTPALPGDLYRTIEQKINRTTRFRSPVYTVAAVLLLSLLSVTAILFYQNRSTQSTVAMSSDVASELQQVSDYLNSDNVEEFTAMYTFIDNY